MNRIHYNILKYKNLPFGAVLLVVAGVFLLSGCAIDFSKYGEYQRKWGVTGMFERGDFPSDYTFYYAHTSSHPKALIGIDPAYALDSHLWTRVDPAEIKHLKENMWIRGDYWSHLYGSQILDPKGKAIGIYYSKKAGGPIVMGPDNKVIVHLPWREPVRNE